MEINLPDMSATPYQEPNQNQPGTLAHEPTDALLALVDLCVERM